MDLTLKGHGHDIAQRSFFVYNALVMHFKIWESFVELKQETERTIVCYNYLIRILIYECNDFNSHIVFLKIHLWIKKIK